MSKSKRETKKVNVPFTSSELASLEATARAAGYKSVEEYIRSLVLTVLPENYEHTEANGSERIRPFFETQLGQVYWGDSRIVMKQIPDESVDLIVTSPPFGLVRKKEYGNEDADDYVRWFKPFAQEFKRILKPQGSLVIDIGGAWKKGFPVKSLYQYELLISLVKDLEFYLAQEFFWWNPSRLPTPAEWVTIRRIRVKDAVNTVWWLSKTPFPKAFNKRVLQPYSESMKKLLEEGYEPKKRPSGHDISGKFQRDNGGSIPPNLIALPNTESNTSYQRYCKEHNLKEHPAKYPVELPAYFIYMLTDPGDLVLDPFAGSLTTGEAAEILGRKWICIEKDLDYIEGGKGRFISLDPAKRKRELFSTRSYRLFGPAFNPEAETEPLPEDGGAKRPSKKSATKGEKVGKK